MESIRIANEKRTLAKIFFYEGGFSDEKSPQAILAGMTKDIRDSNVIGYAGFSTKNHLIDFLVQQIFDSNNTNVMASKPLLVKNSDSTGVIKQAIRDVKIVLPSKRYTRIFVFPSFSKFTKERMGGVSGYTPWKDTILVFIDPTVRNHHKALRNTICHEYVHSVSREYHPWKTLRDSIVFEGLAENFVQDIFHGKLSRWASSVSSAQAKEIFSQIHKDLSSTDTGLHQKIFFKNNKYPLWAGYAIGYHLVATYRKRHPHLSWKNLVQKPPEEFTREPVFR